MYARSWLHFRPNIMDKTSFLTLKINPSYMKDSPFRSFLKTVSRCFFFLLFLYNFLFFNFFSYLSFCWRNSLPSPRVCAKKFFSFLFLNSNYPNNFKTSLNKRKIKSNNKLILFFLTIIQIVDWKLQKKAILFFQVWKTKISV